jgi:hypothetical protein
VFQSIVEFIRNNYNDAGSDEDEDDANSVDSVSNSTNCDNLASDCDQYESLDLPYHGGMSAWGVFHHARQHVLSSQSASFQQSAILDWYFCRL